MKDNGLVKLKKEYMDILIPNELDYLVRKTLKKGGENTVKSEMKFRKAGILAASIVVCLGILVVGVNSSLAFTETLSKVPIVASIVRVLTFREYIVDEDRYNADIKVPEIQGLSNKELERSLNKKYFEENKKLYNDFMVDVEELNKAGGGHMGISSGYKIKTDNDRILSIGRYVVNTAGSSSTTFKYDTIDKKNEILITLPSLFKDDRYVEIISENIKSQMVEQYKADENMIYWVEGIKLDWDVEQFEKISHEQSFYINPEGKLVIAFNKYDVAPGCMGTPEFVIPTDILSDILVSNEYIK